MSEKIFITELVLNQLAAGAADHLVEQLSDKIFSTLVPIKIYGVPRGGVYAAKEIQRHLNVASVITTDVKLADVIVDDLIDSGATVAKYFGMHPDKKFVVLINKRFDASPYRGKWIVFPWEVDEDGIDNSADDIGTRLLQHIGENPEREGLQETPKRFIKAWSEMTSGYGVDPMKVAKSFADGASDVDEMVLLRHIPVESQCEHHMIRFWGWAHIAYIPNGRIMGLSKFNRIVDVFGRRLQVQERLTVQIAEAIELALNPLGVGVVLECRHGCMEARGVQSRGTTTVTSALRGVFREQAATRQEFLALAKSNLPI